MDIKLAQRVLNIKPSPTLAVTARAAEMRAAGKDIIGLGAGEPDFDTPDHIKEAAIQAIKDGFTKYTPVDGTPQLKNAIINKFKNENGLDYEPNQILVSCGGKQSFFNLSLAALEEGDEVIIPAPYWVSYPDMVTVAGATPVFIETSADNRFKVTPAQLEAAITENTRLFVMNSPSNPSGVAYTPQEMKALGEVLLKHPQILIATDDMYEHILWSQDRFTNILNACPELYERTLVLNGVSKAFSMTGWRIGYLGGPVKLVAAMKKIQSQSTSNPTSIAQVAAQAALEGPMDGVEKMKQVFRDRHDFVVAGLNGISGVSCHESDGTFYCFPDFSGVIEKMDGISTDVELAEYLIENANVAVVPGSAFGTPGHMRLSFAVGMETLEEAIARLKKAIEK